MMEEKTMDDTLNYKYIPRIGFYSSLELGVISFKRSFFFFLFELSNNFINSSENRSIQYNFDNEFIYSSRISL